jgi:signal transduction histidine kinase
MKSSRSNVTGTTLQEIYDGLQKIAATTRSLTFELSPPELYDFGLEAAVKGLCQRMSHEHGIPINFEEDGRQKNLEKDRRIALYRMIRELLINAIKHARAKSVRVTLTRSGRNIKITVADDGVGFDAKKLTSGKNRGFGLFSLQDKLQYMGGQFKIYSNPGKGSRFVITAPLSEK